METKNLCAQIPVELHAQVCEGKERAGQSLNAYITNLLRTYYSVYQMQKTGGKNMDNSRTMAFHIPEELFQRIMNHLARETARTGQKLTQRDFVLGLIRQAPDEAEAALNPLLEPHGNEGAATEDEDTDQKTESC